MYKITIIINGEKYTTEITEKGEVLEEMQFKKDVKTSILKVLAEADAHTDGDYFIEFEVEKNGTYYDHDEMTIKVNSDYSDYKIIVT